MPDETLCPRCGGKFHCGAADPAPCPCAALTLNAETLAALRAQYSGCLCMACLAQLQSGAGTTRDERVQSAPD